MQSLIHPIENLPRTSRALERLLAGIAAGDRDALAQLYHRTRTAVYASALAVLKNAHDAQDVTQEVFVRVWERAAQYRPDGSPMGWLLTVTRNEARMHLRRSRTVSLDEAAWDAIPDPAQVCNEDRVLLQHMLAQLDDASREAVLLHAAGFKHREIAHRLGIPLATVLSRHHRALKKLKQMIEGDDRS